MKKQKTHFVRKYFIAGLLVWLPIWATLLVLHFLINVLNTTFSLLPLSYQPDYWLGWRVPGIGVLLSLVVVLLTGMAATNIFGRKLVDLGEAIVQRIPLVRTIYMATKQLIETLVSSSSQSFRKVLLVEYPRKGVWTVAFLTGPCLPEIAQHHAEEMLWVFVPTTPNPTAGFLLAVPSNEVKELDISVEQALKLIISLGMIQTEAKPEKPSLL